MTMIHTQYDAIVADVTGHIKQQAWCEEGLNSLKGSVKEFKGT